MHYDVTSRRAPKEIMAVFVVVARKMASTQKINTIQNSKSENAAICRLLQAIKANKDSRGRLYKKVIEVNYN